MLSGILNSKRLIAEIDNSNMLELLENFPSDCIEAFKLAEKSDISGLKNKYNGVIFCGMGGSSLGAFLVKSLTYQEAKIPIYIIRNYNLPSWADKTFLCIICSYSGNTEETLSCYNYAKSKSMKILMITSGGTLLKNAQANDDTLVKIPQGMPPRTALAYLLIPNLVVLSKLNIITDKREQIKQASLILSNLRDKEIGMNISSQRNKAKQIARVLFNKFPLIYGVSDLTYPCAYRWRTQLAENSKVISSSHFLPEMNHNEIVGMKYPGKLLRDFIIVMIRDRGEHLRIRKRIKVTKSIMENEGIKVVEVHSQGKALLSRLLSLIYIGDFVSFYVAILNKIDPTPVERIDYLKKSLGKFQIK